MIGSIHENQSLGRGALPERGEAVDAGAFVCEAGADAAVADAAVARAGARRFTANWRNWFLFIDVPGCLASSPSSPNASSTAAALSFLEASGMIAFLNARRFDTDTSTPRPSFEIPRKRAVAVSRGGLAPSMATPRCAIDQFADQMA
jgi:hypothetical protein